MLWVGGRSNWWHIKTKKRCESVFCTQQCGLIDFSDKPKHNSEALTGSWWLGRDLSTATAPD